MAEYIERESLIAHLKKDPLFDLIERYGITRVIESIPAANVVERKIGKWEQVIYEELISDLRETAEYIGPNNYELPIMLYGNLLKAADAIEELSRAQEQWITQERNALLKSIPRWIPVTEQLPEENGEYLITWTTSLSKRLFIAICEGEETSEYDYELNRFKFEWLLDDYIKYYPDVEVIAWMPLPKPYEPPKEET